MDKRDSEMIFELQKRAYGRETVLLRRGLISQFEWATRCDEIEDQARKVRDLHKQADDMRREINEQMIILEARASTPQNLLP